MEVQGGVHTPITRRPGLGMGLRSEDLGIVKDGGR